MATKAENEEPKSKDTVEGYAGRPAGAAERPKDASKEAVVSDAGATEPTAVFGGDGVTPEAEFKEKWAEHRKKQEKLDEENRQKAREAAGNVMTTEKGKHG